MSDSYTNTMTKHRRLAILRHLEGCTGYISNASVLKDVLKGVGVTSSRSQIVTEIVWLADNGFATYEEHEDFVVATATSKGVEIALGEARHPEIQRPKAGL